MNERPNEPGKKQSNVEPQYAAGSGGGRRRQGVGEAFFMSVLDGLQTFLASRNLELVVHLCGSDQDPEIHLRRVVERRLVDGIILSQTQRLDSRIAYLNVRKLPFIAFGRSQEPGKYSWLDLDFEGVAEQAIGHLFELGHRRISVVSAANDINFGYVFIEACRKSLAQRGLTLPEEYIHRDALTEAGGYRAAENILALKNRPTAVVLVESTMAIGLYHKFFDQFMRIKPRRHHNAFNLAVLIKFDFTFRQIKFQRLTRIAPAFQHGVCSPQRLQDGFKQWRGLGISHAINCALRGLIAQFCRRTDDRAVKAVANFLAI